MKLVQKILSHGLLIAFIVAAFFIYMNRVDLFPQWFAKPAPATVSPSQATPDSPAAATVEAPVPEAGEGVQDEYTQVPLPVETEAGEPEADVAEAVVVAEAGTAEAG
ncbi:MAG: hypothetical protein ACE5FQ_10910, partial [Thiogranum sp.]